MFIFFKYCPGAHRRLFDSGKSVGTFVIWAAFGFTNHKSVENPIESSESWENKYLPKTAPFGAAVGSARQFALSDEHDRTPAVS